MNYLEETLLANSYSERIKLNKLINESYNVDKSDKQKLLLINDN